MLFFLGVVGTFDTIFTILIADADTVHRFSLFKQLKEEITLHFNKLLKLAGDKLTDICKLDKQIWKALDDEEVKCKEKIEMIEQVRDKQVLISSLYL